MILEAPFSLNPFLTFTLGTMSTPPPNAGNPEALAAQILDAVSTIKKNGKGDAVKSTAIKAARQLIDMLSDPRKKSMELMLNVNLRFNFLDNLANVN
jgi:hypothetical protein